MSGDPHPPASVEVELVPHDPSWSERFERLAAAITAALAGIDHEVHHIGSTAVPGIRAKPIVDVQVSVLVLRREEVVARLEPVGFDHHPDNDDGRKVFFSHVEDGIRRANIHVRAQGEFSQQAALLFRDYLRASPPAAARYEAVKVDLARRRWPTIDHYADAKSDIVWALLREADRWAQTMAWQSPPADHPG